MADVQPLRALHYDLAKVGSLDAVAAPPYDVIDPEQRAALAARSPYNVVRVDLPEGDGGDPYAEAADDLRALAARRAPSCATTSPRCGRSPRTTPGPTAARSPATASSRACASRTTAPGASARTSARTRARRRTGCGSRARRRPTSPPSSASTTTPTGATGRRRCSAAEPFGELTDDDGTVNRLGRVDRPGGDRGLPERARARRAAHRRRPPPLRDRARLRRGDRRRGRAPLRAHVPRRAAGRGADRLPHPPPHPRHHAADPGGAGDHAARALHRRGDRPGRPAPARRRRAR